MLSAIKINPQDNVAVAIEPVAQQSSVLCSLPGGEAAELTVLEEIPIYHKFSLAHIAKGEAVRKYGEVIGFASVDIPAGRHVHVHNVLSEQELKGGQNHGA